MELSFSRLCRDEAMRGRLRAQIDRCALRGQSCELAACALPEGCRPARVTLGFYRRADGAYVMYWRPTVVYRGESRGLGLLFAQCLWSFERYELLSARLGSLRAELGAEEEAPLPCPAASIGSGSLRARLGARVFGQAAAVEAAAYYLEGHLAKCAPARPLSLILHGPTGVGKSELGRAAAELLTQSDGEAWQSVWTELNTFTHAHSVYRLTGAPPGYVGYEDEPVFAAVQRNPRTVFLFDELDKAHPELWKVFMSVLDEGRCSLHRVAWDGSRELDLRRCVFLFTTNLDLSAAALRTVGFAAEAGSSKAAAAPVELAQRLYDENEVGRRALIRHGVLQEVAGRFTGIIGFRPLDDAAQRQIAARKAVSLGEEYGLHIARVTPEAAAALLPAEAGVSIRSALCLIEAKLAPLYRRAAAGAASAALQLTSIDGILMLSDFSSAGFSSSAGFDTAGFDTAGVAARMESSCTEFSSDKKR